MKAIPLLILSAATLAADTEAVAQAITSTVQLTQQSIQNTKSASEGQTTHVSQHGLPQERPLLRAMSRHSQTAIARR